MKALRELGKLEPWNQRLKNKTGTELHTSRDRTMQTQNHREKRCLESSKEKQVHTDRNQSFGDQNEQLLRGQKIAVRTESQVDEQSGHKNQ
jgi:hypothetical protein